MAVQDMLQSITDKIGGVANVDTVFGEAKVMNNRAIIPIAAVTGGFGAGGGEGKMPATIEGAVQQEGSGGGGGGGFMVRPLAILEVTDTNTRLIPILDMTKVILASLGLVGSIIWVFAKKRNRRM
ncbi:MAG: spore germination protein GerW family protein [Armatimonadota bacterium]